MRVIIYTGNKSVGKSSLSALTAVKLANQGLKTLIMSTDPYGLQPIFNMSLSLSPVKINENLWGLVVSDDTKYIKMWHVIETWLRTNMKWYKLNQLSTDEVPIIPGIINLLRLMELNQYIKQAQYDVIIIDSHIIGAQFRLLSYPELIDYWVHKLFNRDRYIMKIVRPFAKIVTGGLELPSNEVMQNSENLLKELLDLQKLFLNRDMTSFRIVLNPDFHHIVETRKLIVEMTLLNLQVDAIMINKILPSQFNTGYFSTWYNQQVKIIKEIQNDFYPLPIFKMPFTDINLVGLPVLEKMSQRLFYNQNASVMLFTDHFVKLTGNGEYEYLSTYIPQLNKENYQVEQKNEILRIYNEQYQKLIYFPDVLRNKTMIDYYDKNGQFIIRFKK